MYIWKTKGGGLVQIWGQYAVIPCLKDFFLNEVAF